VKSTSPLRTGSPTASAWTAPTQPRTLGETSASVVSSATTRPTARTVVATACLRAGAVRTPIRCNRLGSTRNSAGFRAAAAGLRDVGSGAVPLLAEPMPSSRTPGVPTVIEPSARAVRPPAGVAAISVSQVLPISSSKSAR